MCEDDKDNTTDVNIRRPFKVGDKVYAVGRGGGYIKNMSNFVEVQFEYSSIEGMRLYYCKDGREVQQHPQPSLFHYDERPLIRKAVEKEVVAYAIVVKDSGSIVTAHDNERVANNSLDHCGTGTVVVKLTGTYTTMEVER